ncbi:uncharacterized protein LOC141546235 [Sminthopsis crassicaudata]|uniref:uncharacterized protein LOC141546235 n=1 Tax=Sminthopsis crassicaudata TaxID=9301 RepID=UPI003D68F44A
MESTFHSQESARDQEIQNLGQENYKNIDCAEKKIRDKDAQKTCPNKTGGRTQNEEQKSSPLKDKEKGRALQSTNHTTNTFDVLDTLLDKLSEENNEPSHNQEIGLVISESQVQSAPEKYMRKKAYSNTTSRKSKFKKENLSQFKNREHSEFQITNDLLDPTTNQHYLLTTFPGANKQDQNEVTDTHHPLIPMKNKQKIGGKNIANFQQNDGPEESKSKQHRVPVSSLIDYRSTEKLQPDVPTHRNLPHPNSQLENLPFPETDPYNEQQKESKVKKRKKKNEVRKLHKRKKEESIQMTLQCLLQMVQTMEKIVDNLMRSLRKSKH